MTVSAVPEFSYGEFIYPDGLVNVKAARFPDSVHRLVRQ
ncbi:unnamed protein product, partial [marine sediment metagenome]